MNPIELIALSLETLGHRKLRSWLAILGIVIGVASVITLISISLGLSADMSSRLGTLGTNIMTITPGGSNSQMTGMMAGMGGGEMRGPPTSNFNKRSDDTITFKEAEKLKKIDGVEAVNTLISERTNVEYNMKTSQIEVVGTDPLSFEKTMQASLYSGRYLTNGDQYSVVLGYSVANKTFGTLDLINKQIKINDISFRVVGVLKEQGTGTMGSYDSQIFIPLKVAKGMFNQTTDVDKLVISVEDGYDVEEVADLIEARLAELHNIKNEKYDFTITTALTMQETVSEITNSMMLFLGGIASIALIVGGIGVANTMFMSVLEQTKYVGILKSLGMNDNQTLLLFIFESGIIGGIGGILGVLLSVILAGILENFGITCLINCELILLGVIFSIFIGILSGLAPAKQASRIPPIEALRYE